MLYLKNKSFAKDLNFYGLADDYVKEVINDIYNGRSISLGSKIYKIRSARPGHGKSGGFRNIFYWQKDRMIIFVVLFGKNEQGSLSQDEMKALKILAQEYDQLTESEIHRCIKNKLFEVMPYD